MALQLIRRVPSSSSLSLPALSVFCSALPSSFHLCASFSSLIHPYISSSLYLSNSRGFAAAPYTRRPPPKKIEEEEEEDEDEDEDEEDEEEEKNKSKRKRKPKKLNDEDLEEEEEEEEEEGRKGDLEEDEEMDDIEEDEEIEDLDEKETRNDDDLADEDDEDDDDVNNEKEEEDDEDDEEDEEEEDEEEEDEDEEDDEDEEEDEDEDEDDDEDEDEDEEEEEKSAPARRGRGRRKVEDEDEDEDEDEEEDEKEDEKLAPPPRRGPGRPRKNSLSSDLYESVRFEAGTSFSERLSTLQAHTNQINQIDLGVVLPTEAVSSSKSKLKLRDYERNLAERRSDGMMEADQWIAKIKKTIKENEEIQAKFDEARKEQKKAKRKAKKNNQHNNNNNTSEIQHQLLNLPSHTVIGMGRGGVRFERDHALVREEDLRESFVKGSGRGGQKINKTSSCVDLLHMPTGTRVKCQATRSLIQNRKIARTIMAQRLEELVMGKESRVEAQRERIRRKRENQLKRAALIHAGAAETLKKRNQQKLKENQKQQNDNNNTEKSSAAMPTQPFTINDYPVKAKSARVY